MTRTEPTLVKLRASEHVIDIKTVTRQRKSPHWFCIVREHFDELATREHVVVNDCGSFADLRLVNGLTQVRVEFTWLSQYSDSTVKGWTQTVYLDYAEMLHHVRASEYGKRDDAWSMLSVDRTNPRPRLDFSNEGARRTLRDVLSVPVLRHKLTRAVRDNFQWPGHRNHVIRFYADFDKYSFFFQEQMDDRDGISGGLILHRYDGMDKASYSVHT